MFPMYNKGEVLLLSPSLLFEQIIEHFPSEP